MPLLERLEAALAWKAPRPGRCEAEIPAGEIVACPECGAELEVIGLEPCELALAPQEEEDWGE